MGVIKVRRLLPTNAAAYQRVRLQGLRECPSAFASSHEEEAATSIAVLAERLAAKDDRALFGAFSTDELVGIVGVRRESMRKLAHKAILWGMYVAPPARRAGVGRQLVAAALAFAGETLGVRQVNLSVNDKNLAAIALYRRLSFEPFGLERGYLRIDGELHDELHMVCVLPA